MNSLNERAWQKLEEALADAGRLGIAAEERPCGARAVDAGVSAPGGIAAGLAMAEIGMAGLGRASLEMGRAGENTWTWVAVQSDTPLEACYLSQAAHWPVNLANYRAMGSGPGCLLNRSLDPGSPFGYEEKAGQAVLVLEAPALPDDAACRALAAACDVVPERLAVIAAPTASLAGSAQIAARSAETGLHKLHQLGFDLRKVASAVGRCPLAAPTGSDMAALGRTNDMMIYASQVWLAVRGVSDDALEDWANRLPARTSPQYGEPFLSILKRAGDFYRIDPGLFAPAEVTLVNLGSGRSFHAGGVDLARLEELVRG